MSKKHPIVAVTGSSGAGTTTVKRAFEHIFLREGINSAVVEGDSFHRYERAEIDEEVADLVEQECPSVRHLEAALAILVRPGERALLVPEELALQQSLGYASAVDRHEGGVGARAALRAGRAPLRSGSQ